MLAATAVLICIALVLLLALGIATAVALHLVCAVWRIVRWRRRPTRHRRTVSLMPEAAQYLYEVGIFTGSGAATLHTQRFNARGRIREEGWMRFQNGDGDTVFLAHEGAIAFVRRHDTTAA